jgi:protein-S-isoprenylcysteine O-methyltransferase Ste14
MSTGEIEPAPRAGAVVGSLCASTALVTVTALFALAHWQHWRATGNPTGICFAMQEIAVVAVALGRRRPLAVSRRPSDWIAAAVGSYVVLLLRPEGAAPAVLAVMGTLLQVLGAAMAAVCILQLGRNFGVVAANRGLTSHGAYAIVRHPLYAAYLTATIGYLIAAPTAWNLWVVVTAITFQLRRIFAEEAVLAATEEYRVYARIVRWRLIPGVV